MKNQKNKNKKEKDVWYYFLLYTSYMLNLLFDLWPTPWPTPYGPWECILWLTSLQSDCIGRILVNLFLDLLFLLFKPPEVVLDEEGRVELPNSHVVFHCWKIIIQLLLSYSPVNCLY